MTGRFDRLRFLAPLGLVFGLVAGVFLWVGYRINFSASFPPGLYRVSADGPLVSVCLQGEAARLARERGYLLGGTCPLRLAPLMKRIVARTGDDVRVTADGVSINGRALPNSAPMAHDTLGRPLPALAASAPYARRLGAEELWLSSWYNAGSFDSRYIGPVRVGQIQERLTPVWIAPSTRPW